MFPSFIASAPGKVILSGEHAVVHGTQAIATVVGMRAYAQFSVPKKHQMEGDSIEDVVVFRIDYHDVAVRRVWKLSDVVELRSKALEAMKLNSASDASVDLVQSTDMDLNPIVDFVHSALASVQPIRVDRSFSSATAEMKFHEFEELDPEMAKTLDQAPALLFLMMCSLMLNNPIPVEVSIFSNLPMGSGLGSSAALSASIASGFYALQRHLTTSDSPATTPVSHDLTHQDREKINRWAFQGERLIHGNPSGVDNTCSVFGGVVLYRRIFSTVVDETTGETLQKVTNDIKFLPAGCIPKSLQLVITDTRIPKDTKALVAKVGRLKEAQPEVMKHLLAAFDAVSQQLSNAMKAYMDRERDPTNQERDNEFENKAAYSLFTTMLQLFPINQNLLNAVGVGHTAIDQIMTVAQKLSLPAKLTGAGGGGCTITVIPRSGTLAATTAGGNAGNDLAENFESLIQGYGYTCLKTIMGQEGAQISSITQS